VDGREVEIDRSRRRRHLFTKAAGNQAKLEKIWANNGTQAWVVDLPPRPLRSNGGVIASDGSVVYLLRGTNSFERNPEEGLMLTAFSTVDGSVIWENDNEGEGWAYGDLSLWDDAYLFAGLTSYEVQFKVIKVDRITGEVVDQWERPRACSSFLGCIGRVYHPPLFHPNEEAVYILHTGMGFLVFDTAAVSSGPIVQNSDSGNDIHALDEPALSRDDGTTLYYTFGDQDSFDILTQPQAYSTQDDNFSVRWRTEMPNGLEELTGNVVVGPETGYVYYVFTNCTLMVDPSDGTILLEIEVSDAKYDSVRVAWNRDESLLSSSLFGIPPLASFLMTFKLALTYSLSSRQPPILLQTPRPRLHPPSVPRRLHP
jgi:hypothetical protein